MTSSFQVDGLSSGLNTQQIIQSLMAIERRPLQLLQQQRSKLDARTQAWADIKTKFSSLQSAIGKVATRDSVNAKTASTDTAAGSVTLLTASAGATAATGTFKVIVDRLATATSVSSATGGTAEAIGNPIDTSVALNATSLGASLLAGTFTVMGETFTLDPTTDSLSSIVTAMDGALSAAGKANVSIVNDAYGRPNAVRITPMGGQTVQLGSGSDTGNFLSAVGLVANGTAGANVESAFPLGRADTGAPLSGARLATALDGSGTIRINGKDIAWSSSDTLSGVISRINASNVGVRAAYDRTSDRVTLTSTTLGNASIAAEDVGATNGLLAALKLTGATQSSGQTAKYQYSLDGTTYRTGYGNTNTIADAVTGVTLNLKATSATPVTVTVAQDTAKTTKTLQDFITAYNDVLDTIDQYTAYDPAKKQGSVLTGDVSLQGLQMRLRSLTSRPMDETPASSTTKYRTFADLGVSTGAVGTGVSARRLVLDQTKLDAALADNPLAVENVLAGFLNSTGSLADTPGNLQSISGAPTLLFEGGTMTIDMKDTAGAADVYLTSTDGMRAFKTSTTFTAGDVRTNVIAGMTLTMRAAGPFVVGQSTFDVILNQRGVGVALKSAISGMIGTSGVFDTKSAADAAEAQRLDARIADYERRLTDKEASLNVKFTALETALSRIQGQSSALSAQLAQL